MKIIDKQIVYRIAESTDKDNILRFIREHYYPEEPITIGREPLQQSAEDEEFSLSTIEHGTTIVATDTDTNSIVGVLLSSPIVPGDADEMIEEAAHCSSKKWSEILLLLAHLEHKANVCERYKVSRALHMHVMGVNKHLRGHSIGVKLMQKCMEQGKKLGYPIASVDCTSVYSIRIAEKLNMVCISEVAYADYTNDAGEQIFRPPAPHTHIKTFINLL